MLQVHRCILIPQITERSSPVEFQFTRLPGLSFLQQELHKIPDFLLKLRGELFDKVLESLHVLHELLWALARHVGLSLCFGSLGESQRHKNPEEICQTAGEHVIK